MQVRLFTFPRDNIVGGTDGSNSPVTCRITPRRQLGTTMIYITHDQEEAFAMSDRIMVMGEAKIHQIGTPDEVLDAPADAYVRSFVIDNLQAKIASLARYMR